MRDYQEYINRKRQEYVDGGFMASGADIGFVQLSKPTSTLTQITMAA